MRKVYCCIVFLLSSFCIHAQENSFFVTGFEETISSKILEEDRQLLIHIPKSNGGNKIKDSGNYPVLYLLDGAENFNSVVSITEHMEESGLGPPMIVVGIIHSNRMDELTTGSDKDMPKQFVGHGEKFMSFVENELIPHVNSTFPTTIYKIFIGHSVGGLTVMNTFLHHPDLFNSYVSLDGALWWDNAKIVKEAKAILTTHNYKGKALFMAMANRLERGVDTLSVLKDTSENTDLIRANLKFIKELQNTKSNQLRYKYKFYEDDNHSSVRLIGEYDALRFIFEFYKLKIYDSELENPDFNLDLLLISHYNNISKEMGYIIKPGESQVNNLGYQMMAAKQFKKAESLFKLNIINHPTSGNCYDSIGDLYVVNGDKAKAIESFKKALTLKDIPETKVKLEKLLNIKK